MNSKRTLTRGQILQSVLGGSEAKYSGIPVETVKVEGRTLRIDEIKHAEHFRRADGSLYTEVEMTNGRVHEFLPFAKSTIENAVFQNDFAKRIERINRTK